MFTDQVHISTPLLDDLEETIHDLSQPLLACVHYLQRLRQSNLTQIQKKEFENLEQSLYRAISLFRKLRKETVSVVGKHTCCVNTAIERVVGAYSSQLEERKIEAIVQLCPSLPPVSGNGTQLERVFSNLLLNAMEAMESQQSQRCVLLKTDFESSRRLIRITIADSGPGVPIEILPRIFDPSFTTKLQGIGLGLAICRAIVFEHNGWIEARNRPEGGAAFEIYLPAVTKSVSA